MILSLCIPCMNRAYALRTALPVIINAVEASPPIEVVVIDYSSTDRLDEYLNEVSKECLPGGSFWTIGYLPNKKFYNSPHARNLAARACCGEYLIQLSAEALPKPTAFAYLRERIEKNHPLWMCESWSGRWVVCQRQEFVSAGGYDERFDVYGPEDREICDRLHRRGGKFESFPTSLIDEIPTPNTEKLRNLNTAPYKGPLWVKRMMHRAMAKIYDENTQGEILVANPGGWGRWE